MSASSSPGSSPAASTATRACHNCGAALTGPWCAACGQEDRPLDPTLRDVLVEAWQAVTNVEGPAFRSLVRLFASPGLLTREYLQGRRGRWVSPMRLYVLVSVVYFGLTSLTGWVALDIRISVSDSVEAQQDLAARGFSTGEDIQAVAEDAVGVWMPRAMFLLLPVFAALVALAQRSAHRAYPQHVVFALHAHAAAFATLTLVALLGVVGSDAVDAGVQGAALIYGLCYLVMAQRSVYGGTWLRNVVLGVVIGVAYWAAIVAVTVGIVAPVVFS